MRLLGSLVLVAACVTPTAQEPRAPAPTPASSSPPISSSDPVAAVAAPRTSDSDVPGALAPPADRCPAEPETRNNYKDDDGCPDELPADLSAILGNLSDIEFDLDKSSLRPHSYAALDRLVEVLQRHPDVRLHITNHSADDGYPAYSICLTCRRADAIKRYLVEHGVDHRRLEATGMASDQPIDTNKTPAGRKRNRRTELRLAPPAPL